ncbi:MAG: hypothetical protein DRR19_27665 [Candidatus Parabeggiatoa sp. nov. 1]|nr:MAG: hypothetical protein DRR19_27665 [Gammaproteobacteria bacterium]
MSQRKRYSKRGLFVLLITSLFLPQPVVADGIELKWNGGYLSPNSKGKEKGIRYGINSLMGLSAVAKYVSLEFGFGQFFSDMLPDACPCSLATNGLLANGYSAYAEVGLRTPAFFNVMGGVVAGQDFYLDSDLYEVNGRTEKAEGGYYLGLDLFYQHGKNRYVKVRYQSYGDDSDFDGQISIGFGVKWE